VDQDEGGNPPIPDRVGGLVELGTNVGKVVSLNDVGKAVGRLVVTRSKDAGSVGVSVGRLCDPGTSVGLGVSGSDVGKSVGGVDVSGSEVGGSVGKVNEPISVGVLVCDGDSDSECEFVGLVVATSGGSSVGDAVGELGRSVVGGVDIGTVDISGR
jgi:hypothetical protein